MAAIFDLPVISTTDSIYTKLIVLLDPENIKVAVEISRLLFVQADIIDNAFAKLVHGGHLGFTSYPGVGEYPRHSRRVAAPPKL